MSDRERVCAPAQDEKIGVSTDGGSVSARKFDLDGVGR